MGQDTACGMALRAQQRGGWGDGGLGAPWLSLTVGTGTRSRVWGAFPIVPRGHGPAPRVQQTRLSRLHGPGGATCALRARRPGHLPFLPSGSCLFFAVYFKNT